MAFDFNTTHNKLMMIKLTHITCVLAVFGYIHIKCVTIS